MLNLNVNNWTYNTKQFATRISLFALFGYMPFSKYFQHAEMNVFSYFKD